MIKKWSQPEIDMLLDLYEDHTWKQIATNLNRKFGTSHTANATRKAHERHLVLVKAIKDRKDSPKILFFDIETVPIISSVWKLWRQCCWFKYGR